MKQDQINSRARIFSRRMVILCVSATVLGLTSCGQSNPAKTEQSTDPKNGAEGRHEYMNDVTAHSGIQFTCKNGEEANHFTLLETLGGGGAALDFDGDGLLDIFLTGGGFFAAAKNTAIRGFPCRLFKNLGKFRFQDVTKEVGLEFEYPYTQGATAGDYDLDGWPDLLITGYGRVILLRNTEGKDKRRFFQDVTGVAGLDLKLHWPTSSAFADFDGDGFPDLYVCQYVDWSFDNNPKCTGFRVKTKRDVCPPKRFQPKRDFLFRNDGKGHFIDVAKSAGLRVDRPDGLYGKGLGVLVVDFNDDQKPDVYVANDTTENFLFLNQSQSGRIRFADKARDLGAARDDMGLENGSMGIDSADVDGSGMPSIWVTNFEGELHAMYQMRLVDKERRFFYKTQMAGMAVIGNSYVGWETAFLDIDNDSWMDVIVTNGHVMRYPPRGNFRQQPVLFRNKGKGTFTNVTGQGGDYFNKKHRGRGLIAGDFDNDGKMDVVISHVNEPVAVLRNVHPNKNHWLGVYLRGKDNRDVVGAKVTLQLKDRVLTRFQKSGGSYLSSSDPRLLFGLGPSSTTGKVIVHWPTGSPRIEHWDGLAVDRYHDLRQGQGKSK